MSEPGAALRPRRAPRSGQALIDAAAALVPQLRGAAVASEQRGWLAEDTLEALADGGFFSLGVPQRHGGTPMDWSTHIAVVEQLSRGCGSTGWVMALYYGDTWIVTKFPSAAQDEVFASGTGRISGATTLTGTLVPTDGGYILNGRWGFHTGCPGADWSLPCARVMDGDGTREADEPRFALVPMGQMEILADWDVFGMAGTGSNTVTATDVFVPEHRTIALASIDGSVQIGAVGVVIGMARAAIELFLESLPGRSITYTHYNERREAPITHLMVAEAQLRVDTAQSLVAGMVERLEACERDGQMLSADARAILLAHKAHIFRLSREAVEIIYSQSGASVISRSAPIQRIFRDIEAICQHAMHQVHTNLERYGQHLTGVEGWVFGD